ncbi:hypothetical protein GPECTOR_33g622 [Gonium pectorale]|uniref:DNA-directed DNA polymerase family A palm domain-containing protein n=1 Tax=Gonium pectorale TaxID=33097 RepID=A0A150GEG5_GONPE|nr:hypothetical protein GPECTOR_33g622 [Gonium pectorale]|eukprot:KXZ47740.1 hypothetical protein GPECTOR_33g622 [Gonium pectorale]
MCEVPPDILVVDTPEVARAVVDRLLAEADRPYPGAADRKNPPVAFIDVTTETPVGHGAVLCFSIYGGDDLDFSDCDPRLVAAAAAASPASGAATDYGYGYGYGGGAGAGAGPVRKDRIWVDVWDEVELDAGGRPVMEGRHVKLKEHHPIIEEFRRFFENEDAKKVWHNYGFDRHVLENMGIRAAGFGGDTLHMARLADASRSGKRTYGLDNLTADPTIMKFFTPYGAKQPERERTGSRRRAAAAAAAPGTVPQTAAAGSDASSASPGAARTAALADVVRAKVGMKERFGMLRVRSGVVGKVPELPPMQELHARPLFRPTWIDYSALDAKATWQLREALEGALRNESWQLEASLASQLGYPAGERPFLHLWHFYCSYWLDFGELLTEMERRGMMVNRQHLAEAQFLDWAASKVPGARYMNVGSGLQIRTLLFPDHLGFPTKAAAADFNKARAAAEREARKAAKGGRPPPGVPAAGAAAAPLPLPPLPPDGGGKVLKVPNPHYEEELAAGKKPARTLSIELHGIWGRGVPGRLVPELLTETGAAAVSIKVLRGLAGKPGAARKELTKLLEARAAKGEADAAAAAAAKAAAERVAVPLVDELDEIQARTGRTCLPRLTLRAVLRIQKRAVPCVYLDWLAADGDTNGGEGDEAEVPAEASAGPLSGPVPVVDDPTRLAALEAEAKDKGLGKLFVACGGGEEGLRACVAVEALCEVNAIDKLLSAFIIPLQSDATSTTTFLPAAAGEGEGEARGEGGVSAPSLRPVHRVHCSLNINTETGRLSARRPNLQNQPALEKDRYKVRKAFTADTAAGKTLVVADYGQLELRILAHMTNCESMKQAFILGGDFHSRTAYGMYDYIQKDVADGAPDVLNFSIAYGKTAHGLAVDFKTTKEEAQQTVDKWYADRWEVRKWQEETKQGARDEGKVRTLLGRTRPLPNINSNEFRLIGHSERAAINTPIQGSAADVAAAAMVAISKSEELRATGFQLLMQIHDEVILEGPSENAAEAQRLVMKLMANPWAELAKHWNDPAPPPVRSLLQGPGWRRPVPRTADGREGHVAGVWNHDQQHLQGGNGAGGPQAGGEERSGGGGGAGGKAAMPLLVELATDCNVADTWYEAK